MTPSRALVLNARLETRHLVLEPLAAAHAPAMFARLKDDALYVWISAAPPESVGHLQKRWERLESRLAPAGDKAWLNWAVRQASDGAYVGKMDAEVDAANIATNIGYLIFPAFWGRGYASEAVAAVIEHLRRHGVEELRATVTSGNTASTRVLEKSGFVRTRVIPENDVIRGVKHDDIEYVLTFTPEG
ncbi:MAG: GNAT family N-acetyltransferase [Elusimicrobiota bacterium]